jgi:hypothetical protein
VKGKRKKQQREADENRTERFERGQRAYPCAAYPRASKTSGPRQQADAPIAATMPATRNPIPFLVVDFLDSSIEAFVQL